MSLITASRPLQPQSSVVSASALLRASERLQSMHSQGGDVTCSFGALYTLGSDADSSGLDERHEQYDSPHARAEQRDDGDDESGQTRSTLPLSSSTFLTDFDHFSIDPIKRTPAESTQTQAQPQPQPPDAPQLPPVRHTHTAAIGSVVPSSASLFSASFIPPPSRLSSAPSVPVCDVRAWLNESIIDCSEPYQPAMADEVARSDSARSPLPVAARAHSAANTEQSATWRRMYARQGNTAQPLSRGCHLSYLVLNLPAFHLRSACDLYPCLQDGLPQHSRYTGTLPEGQLIPEPCRIPLHTRSLIAV